jgi:hypothetical protein
MAAIGSGINPALGRVDYSPFLQGAQMAAQGRMQGSNALTEGVSQGFQDYLKKREQNAILEGRNNALLRDISRDPELSSVPEIQKYTAKMAKGGGLTLNDNIKLNAELTTAVEATKARREEKRQQEYLAIQKQQAEIANERAAREKAEAARTLKVQQSFIDIAKNSPDTLKNPKEAFFAAVSSGASVPEAIQLSNWSGSQQDAELALAERNMAFTERALSIAEKVRNGENVDKEPNVQVVTQNGVKAVIVRDQFNKIVATQIVGPDKLDKGGQIAAIAKDYWAAKGQGDPVGIDTALENYRAAVGGRDGPLMSREMLVEGVEKFGKGGGLEVTSLKRKEDSPSPSAEDKRVTQSPNPSQAASSMSLGGGYQPLANASAFQSPVASMGQPAAQAPSQAPATPAAPRPPVQDIVIPTPAQDIVIPPSLPTQDIILDDALVVRPGVSGSFKVDRDKAVASDDYEFGARGYGYLPKPGEKLNATQGLPILKRMEGELKLSKARLELLEPKAKDSADTLALKKIIPYLPNKALSMRLLKELSEGKQPSLSALNKDPFARSMLAAAKEGRLPQLNMAAIGRS